MSFADQTVLVGKCSPVTSGLEVVFAAVVAENTTAVTTVTAIVMQTRRRRPQLQAMTHTIINGGADAT
jgi:hypothetical protein